MEKNSVAPPVLIPLFETLAKIPVENIQWIVDKHVKYLDDKIHEIDVLTEYLASCEEVETERLEFINFVLDWTRKDTPDLDKYILEYAKRYHTVRETVEKQCNTILDDPTIWENKENIVKFWREFAYMNEIDSLHGMFLTSGRWNVNVMLPTVKELIVCWLPVQIADDRRNEWAYQMARRIITPRYADVEPTYESEIEKGFIGVFIPILQHFDRKLLFLFDILAKLDIPNFNTLAEFTEDVVQNSTRYVQLLEMGVYPPFAWHELHSSRKPRRSTPNYEEAIKPLLSKVNKHYLLRAEKALSALTVFKDYELNYNNYNYKGRFNIVSKFFYLRTSDYLPSESRDSFLDAILGDRFYEALAVVENAI